MILGRLLLQPTACRPRIFRLRRMLVSESTPVFRMYMIAYVYIYIDTYIHTSLSLSLYIYIYIYHVIV